MLILGHVRLSIGSSAVHGYERDEDWAPQGSTSLQGLRGGKSTPQLGAPDPKT